jgi:hypothetical protein
MHLDNYSPKLPPQMHDESIPSYDDDIMVKKSKTELFKRKMYYYDVTDEAYEHIPQVYLNNIETSFQ